MPRAAVPCVEELLAVVVPRIDVPSLQAVGALGGTTTVVCVRDGATSGPDPGGLDGFQL